MARKWHAFEWIMFVLVVTLLLIGGTVLGLSAFITHEVEEIEDRNTTCVIIGSDAKLAASSSFLAQDYSQSVPTCGQCEAVTLYGADGAPAGSATLCNNQQQFWIVLTPLEGWCWNSVEIDVHASCRHAAVNSTDFLYRTVCDSDSGCCTNAITLAFADLGMPPGSSLCVAIHENATDSAQQLQQDVWGGCPDGSHSCTHYTQLCPPETPPPGPAPPCTAYRTQTQSAWGSSAGAVAAYRNANFTTCFGGGGGGVTIGCPASLGSSIQFTTSAAIDAFIPKGGTPSTISGTLVNPGSTDAGTDGTFAGQLLAAKLNVGFDSCEPDFSPCANLLGALCMESSATARFCNGFTVDQIIRASDFVIGGCVDSACTAPAVSSLCQLSPAVLAACLDVVNSNFDSGIANAGNLVACTE